MSVPHTSVFESKTMEGHGTEAMEPSKRQEQAVITTQHSKDSHDGRGALPSWASPLILQSIEETFQMKGVDAEWPPQPRFEFGVAFS